MMWGLMAALRVLPALHGRWRAGASMRTPPVGAGLKRPG